MAAIGILLENSLRGLIKEGYTLSELFRKAIHLSAVLVPILTEMTSKALVLTALVIITIVYCFGELLRVEGRTLPIITTFTLRMSRPQEGTHVIVRPIYFAVGIIVTLLLFPSTIAYASIMILAVGDPVAALVGERVGRLHVRKKTVEGSLAGLIASFILTSITVSPFTALIGSGGGMLMEFIDEPDDNLTMPIISGALMMAARLVHLSS